LLVGVEPADPVVFVAPARCRRGRALAAGCPRDARPSRSHDCVASRVAAA
jgi:hypothetical protein